MNLLTLSGLGKVKAHDMDDVREFYRIKGWNEALSAIESKELVVDADKIYEILMTPYQELSTYKIGNFNDIYRIRTEAIIAALPQLLTVRSAGLDSSQQEDI